jgi:hypothetical protein
MDIGREALTTHEAPTNILMRKNAHKWQNLASFGRKSDTFTR